MTRVRRRGATTNTVTIIAAKSRFPRLLTRIEQGEETVIVRRRMSIAKLVPVTRTIGKRRFGVLRGKVSVDAPFFAPLPKQQLKSWE